MLTFIFLEFIHLKDNIFIDENIELQEFKEYCKAEYKTLKPSKFYTLKKLIIFHRHGDRSSIRTEATNWHSNKCIKCVHENDMINNCSEIECTDGLLTVKGYNQMKLLGKFIKNAYPDTLQSRIKTRCTFIDRTCTALHGVYYGLTGNDSILDVGCHDEDSENITLPKNCSYLEDRVNNRVSDNFSTIKKLDNKKNSNLKPETIADTYMTALCNKISLNCSEINCDIDIIRKYIEASNKSWVEQSQILLKDEEVLSITFGVFVRDLISMLRDEYHEMYITSVHDKSLAMLMAGLGIELKKHPPYASAIFIEVLERDKRHFIRIIYNDKTCNTIIDDEDYIPLEKFIKYAKIFEMTKKKQREKCEITNIINSEDIDLEID